MNKRLRDGVRWMALGTASLLNGCGGGFFVDTKSTTTTGSSSADYVYVVNQTTDTLSEFVVGSGTLTTVSGSPISLVAGLAPASVAVSLPNTYVFVGGNGAISSYAIGTGGALTIVNGGSASATANFISLETSPDGQWLLGLDSLTQSVYVFKINTSTGALTLNSTATYTAPGSGTSAQKSIRMSPNAAFVAAALGPGGDVLFTFNTATGVLTQTAGVQLLAGFQDNSVVFDANSAYLFVARYGGTSGSGGVSSYGVSSAGLLTSKQTLAAGGNAPYGLLLDATGAYLYAANRGDGTISGFTVTSGNLTALASSPFPAGAFPIALAEDNSKKYVIGVAAGGSSDVSLYAFDALTNGKLDAVGVIASGTEPAGSVAVAATH